MPTEIAVRMKDVATYVAPIMKAAGFRKRANNFNRLTADGLTHVLGFEMARFEPIPPNLSAGDQRRVMESRARVLGPSKYGSFTVNLGVFIPEIHRVQFSTTPTFIGAHDCQILQRLGHIMERGDEGWWSLDPPTPEIGLRMSELISEYGIPYLDSFPDREAIHAKWDAGDDPFRYPRPLFDLAVMRHASGDLATATSLMQAHAAAANDRHLPFVREVSRRLGIQLD
ncbi:MAG: DUF4304 domain-containing protein [Actinomycetota bacterium]